MERWLFLEEIDAINCVDFFNTLLLVRVANMDNGNIARHNFFYTMVFFFLVKQVSKSWFVAVVVFVLPALH